MKALAAIGLAAGVMVSGAVFGAGAGAQPAGGAPGRTVYAWFPRDFGNWDTRALDWSALTYVCFRSVELQPDGTLKEVVKRADVKRFVEEAHRHGVKVSVLVWGTTAAGSSEYLARNPEKAVQSLLDCVKANNLDGINMDDETWASTNTVTGQPNRELVSRFFALLNKDFKAARPDYHITWASPAVINPQDKYAVSWPDYY
jgi:(2Fe-2S) ferredoxin